MSHNFFWICFAIEEKSVFTIHLGKLDRFLLTNYLKDIRDKKGGCIILIPEDRKFRRFPYLFFLLSLKKEIKKHALAIREKFFVYPCVEHPSFVVPCDRGVYLFVETRFYHRSKSFFKFFLKRLFLIIFGFTFCKYPMAITLYRESERSR